MNALQQRLSLIAVAVLVLLVSIPVAWAHAELESSDPAANATLDAAPTTIRLWVAEPVEPTYSRFSLIDQTGVTVETPRSAVAPDNARELVMEPGALAKGIYTVSWRTVSASDGHSASGSFSFGIGVAVTPGSATPAIDERVAPDSVAVRWFNLIALSLLMGGVGFLLMACSAPFSFARDPRSLRFLAVIGWLAVGIAGVLMILLQAATAGGTSLLGAFPLLGGIITDTGYGSLWLVRQALWLAVGATLLVGGRSRSGLWLALALGAGILLTQSLFTHASAAQDAPAAIVGDWLHLLAATLWIGGLAAFLAVLTVGRGEWVISAEACGQLVAAFSNYARVAVIALIVSGLYASWLDVGSVTALFTTVYGRALLLKLILIFPLLVLAAVNLLVTSRRLDSGDVIWVKRLRLLVGLEFSLSAVILVMVAVMTSGSPSRTVEAANAAAAQAASSAQAYSAMKSVDDLTVHLSISPGTVGENSFSVMLMSADNQPVDNASLIRLRFDNQQQDLGQSELRPTPEGDGIYAASGANLSVPGDWRVRMTIQRPGKFDSVVDFTPDITAPVPAAPTPMSDYLPESARTWATLLTGIALLALGGVYGLRHRKMAWTGARVIGAAMLAAGFVFAATGVWLAKGGGTVEVVDAWARPALQTETAAVYLTIENSTSSPVQVTAVQADVSASATLHQTQISDNVARMRDLNVVDVPAGASVEFEPGGAHIMLEGLTQPLRMGDSFGLMLKLSTGDELMIPVTVQADAPATDATASAEDEADEYGHGG